MPPLDDRYPNLPILVHWHALPGPAPFSRRQVIVGPCYETVEGPDGFVSINVPFGTYDIKTVIDRLPAHQRPEAIVVALDATKSSVPCRLDAVDCPKALLMGDTHHLEAPLRFMLGYVLAERFDLLVGTALAQHLHFFALADRGRIAWIPGIWVRNFGYPFREERTDPPVFVGSVGDYHPHRRRLLAAVTNSGLPLEIVSGVTQQEAARRYNRSIATLNNSLNGDLNMRVFEALGHGGFLITERLAPEAGLERLFADRESLVIYDGADELIATLRSYLDRPRDAVAIARRGFELYEREHRPDIKARQLFSELLGDGRQPAPSWIDPRAERPGREEPQSLLSRILVYEHVQELHRVGERLSLLATPEVDGRTLTDLVDLPRLALRRQDSPRGRTDTPAALIDRLGYGARVPAAGRAAPADLLLTTSAGLTDGRAAGAIEVARASRLILSDATAQTAADDERAARGHGYTRIADQPAVFVRPG